MLLTVFVSALVVMLQPGLAHRQAPDGSCGCGSAEAIAANQVGWEAHRRRSLDEASASYDRALALAPPRSPTSAEKEIILRFAPLLHTTPKEPFALKDIVAVLHPTLPWVAYHIIWDDDIDFPDDNDPSDHEVVWVQFNKERSRLVNYYTYFHGRVMEAPPLALAQAAASGGRPSVVVQWGKHGTMPLYWQPLTIVADMADIEHDFYPIGKAITLETYNRGIYEKLKTLGPRGRESPLAKGWPRKFNGTWEEFTDFSKVFDSATMLRKKRMWEVTCFGMAVMNRHFLRYNVRAKIEWPEALCSDP